MIRTRLHFVNLPHFLRVYYYVRDNIVYVEVESLVHTHKVVKLPTQYLLDYVANHTSSFYDNVRKQIENRWGSWSLENPPLTTQENLVE